MDLDRVPLGATGLVVSELPFGTWRFGRETTKGRLEIDDETAHELLDTYETHGGRFIDTADVYGEGQSESWIGDWLEHRDREDFVIASKIFWPTKEEAPNRSGLNRKHLRGQLDLILHRLGTDYLDILYIHRWDRDTPAREFMTTLSQFVDEGRVHYLGASTLRPNTWRIAEANEMAERAGLEPFTVTQPRYNLIDRETEGEYLEFCRERGLAVLTWSPLSQGFLTGKYERGEAVPDDSMASDSEDWADRTLTDENFDALDVLREVAEEVDASLAQVALAWQSHKDGITAPILGARTVDQLEENLGAATVDLSGDQVERLDEAKDGPYADLW